MRGGSLTRSVQGSNTSWERCRRETTSSLLQAEAEKPSESLHLRTLLRRGLRRRVMEAWERRARAAAAAELQSQDAAENAVDTAEDARFTTRRTGIIGAMLDSAAGGTTALTWTDTEMCIGCRAIMEVVMRNTGPESSVRDIMFAIHSACGDQPEVFQEACTHATHYDAELAILRQQSTDGKKVCENGGMCYGGKVGGGMSNIVKGLFG